MSDLRIGIVGAGMMGTDHLARITGRVSGAAVSAIIEPHSGRAARAASLTRDAAIYARIEDAINDRAVDAVIIATPAPYHESALLSALDARLPIFCEKPLTADPESSRRVLAAEQRMERPSIQIGFMRRFDPEYRQLRSLIEDRSAGELLMLRCVHRNPSTTSEYTQEMLITDSLVHEFDIAPWLAGSAIRSIEVRHARRNTLAPQHLHEPILVLAELANGVLVDIEMNANVQFGYQVATEAVFERGVARIGANGGPQIWRGGTMSIAQHQDFKHRFQDAYDAEVQAWIGAARQGAVAEPTAWDGYLAALACEAGVAALRGAGSVPVVLPPRPAFYA